MDQTDTLQKTGSFIRMVRSPFRFKLFLLKRLPMAFLSGLRLHRANAERADVSVSLSYLTKNPFRSVYFACLAMAAELSTGILAMNAIEQSGHRFSLLVVSLEAEFVKKAMGRIIFSCNEGAGMKRTLAECLKTDEPATFTASSNGKNEIGETVARFRITWSFKPKAG